MIVDAIEVGSLGATRQSWREPNPREVLLRIIGENKRASEARLRRLMLDQVREDDGLLEAVVEYWFANNYRSLLKGMGPLSPIVERRAARDTRIAAAKDKLVKRIRAEAKIVLLDMVLPHGKPLRDTTGNECAALSATMGGWLGAIGEKIGPFSTVGSALSEADVRELWTGRPA